MANYYEILKVQPLATTAEIESALDTQYNYWRRLVTHHDPETVQRANQALIHLEQVRSTLTDSAKRAAYDTSLNAKIGGLADPTLTGQPQSSTTFAPPKPASTATLAHSTPPPVLERVDAWICPQCQKANPLSSMFCSSCGKTLGQTCANCKTVYEAKATFCPACGQTPDQVKRRQEIELRIQQKQTEVSQLNTQASSAKSKATYLEAAAAGAIGWTGLLAGVTLVYGPAQGFSMAGDFLVGQGGDFFPSIGRFLFSISGIAGSIGLVVIWLLALGLFVYVMLARLRLNWLALGGYVILSIFALACSLGHPLLASLIAGGLVLALVLLTYQREPRAWIALGLVGALDIAALIGSAFLGPFISIITLPLAAVLGLIGLRAWTLADLESKLASESDMQSAQKLAQLNKEIEGLRQELMQA